MSLDNDMVKELKKAIEDVGTAVSNILDVLDQLNDEIKDNHEELSRKIHTLDSFCRNILEKNQQTIWQGLKDIGNLETDNPE